MKNCSEDAHVAGEDDTGITTTAVEASLKQQQPARFYIERVSLEDYQSQAEEATRVHLQVLVSSDAFKEKVKVNGLDDVRMWNWQARRGPEGNVVRAQEAMHIQNIISMAKEKDS